MSRTGPVPLLLALSLGLLATGCGKFREISACRALVREVNPVLDQIEALASSKKEERELLMAQQYSTLSKRLAPRGLGETPLASAVRDYAAILASADNTIRAHAEAVKHNNSARIAETRRELERLLKRERAAVARISVECHA